MGSVRGRVLLSSFVLLSLFALIFMACSDGGDQCTPSCTGKCCGDDGCGGVCGNNCSLTSQTCNADTCLCEEECQGVDCEVLDKECGNWDDGCGVQIDCGTCPGTTDYCTPEGQCVDDCAGLACGPSPNLEADCGTCPGATGYCSAEGQCVDDCAGLDCGSSPHLEADCGTCSGATPYCTPSGRCEVVQSALTWLSIPGGTFQMGSDAGDSRELPVHPVTVPSFEMSKTEVTVEQYQVCVEAGTCTLPNDNTASSYCNRGYSDRGAHPVNCVDWDQAVAFCTWAGGRLPSEAEWEYAARSGGQDITYPWGDETTTCEYAVMWEGGLGCGEDRTWAVCSKTDGDTDQGLCDMAGNVGEWVQDWYHDDYTGAPDDGSAWEDSGSSRVKRGGGFNGVASGLRAAFRYFVVPSIRVYNLGFRCAR
ncbi:MAG: formylglycine-generating enzyme family protein [Deltaproteobacteria bacterium]|nr:formylglycine-generating enzyme family protein [Deltaproteobacteria bacterium]